VLAAVASEQAAQRGPVSVLLTQRGGHNGFHAPGDSLETGCWSDRVASAWLTQLSSPPGG
jgi:hypothetical protein